MIIPHGRLYKIPFEALLAQKPENFSSLNYGDLAYMVKQWNISYHYSVTLYINSIKENPSRLSKKSKPKLDFLGFAPVFAENGQNNRIQQKDFWNSSFKLMESIFNTFTRDGEYFWELPYSKQEIKDIANAFTKRRKKNRIFLHQQATEKNFKRYAGDYHYIHLATHSFMNEKKPGLSGIVFSQHSGKTVTDEDGVLYTGEAYNLNLQADLVVLSSCESGMGKLMKGEGMMALNRGFLYSGARNVVFSLWKVNDKYTSKLMTYFYSYILAGEKYRKALRFAKLAMLKDRNSARPLFWSGFVLLGE